MVTVKFITLRKELDFSKVMSARLDHQETEIPTILRFFERKDNEKNHKTSSLLYKLDTGRSSSFWRS